jgi:hypothetical protein
MGGDIQQVDAFAKDPKNCPRKQIVEDVVRGNFGKHIAHVD